ncbi:MAG: DUF6115 domain-containing protein [Bacillota bacterium]
MMQTFIITISLILNVTALLAIVLLYTRQNRLLEVEKRQEKAVKEMEDVISSYLLEMKEDNDRFIQEFQSIREMKHFPGKGDAEKQTTSDQTLNQDFPSPSASSTEKTLNSYSYKRRSAVKAYKQEQSPDLQPDGEKALTSSESKTSSFEDPFYSQIVRLQEQGYTLEEIASELGKGVTEIELLLKFRQKQK